MIKRNVLQTLLLVLLAGCSSLPRTNGLLECDTDKFQKRADVNLFNAAKAGDIQNLKEALSDKANLNAADRLGQTALMWASWNGHEEIIQELVRHNDTLLASKKKKSEPLKYNALSEEKYNALFCIVMSNSFQKKAALSCMDLLLEKEPQLLSMNDQYNENCLHKAVRSGNEEYLIFFLDRLKKEKKEKMAKMIEQKNSFSETPLILAVKLQQLDMVNRLVELSDIKVRDAYGKSLPVIAFDGGKGNYNVYLSIMKEKLRRIVKEEEQASEHTAKIRTQLREDAELFEALNAVNSMRTAAYITPFYVVYNKLRNGAVNPEELDDNFFHEAEKKFFSLLTKNSLTQDDIRSVKEQLYGMPALMHSRLENQDMKKTALQLCIENGSIDLFKAIFKELKMNRVPTVASGCGNYLIWAIRHKQTDIIQTLLDYNASSRACPQELMATYHTFSPDLSDFKTGNPVVQFLRTDNLRSNESLLNQILSYYKIEFSSNPNYAGQIFETAIKYGDEKLLLSLIKYEGFYCIEKVFGGRPLQFELFEREYFETLKLFIEHGNLKFDWKDNKNDGIKFKELLEKRIESEEDENYKKSAQEILDLLRKKGLLDMELQIFDRLRN